jgi:hypothetical protein
MISLSALGGCIVDLLVELAPMRRYRELVMALQEHVTGFDVPEAPMGVPRPSSVVVSALIKRALGDSVKVFAHVRLGDVNPVGLASLVLGAEVAGIDGVLLTTGDKPAYGEFVRQITTEDAVDFLRRVVGVKVSLGAVISLRYGVEAIYSRLERPFSFYHVLRASRENVELLKAVSKRARELNKRLYAYLLVATERNRGLVESLRQPFVNLESVEEEALLFKDLVDGLIVSCPNDREGLIEATRALGRVV